MQRIFQLAVAFTVLSSTGLAQIPASFFGMHSGNVSGNATAPFPLQVSYRQWRNLSTGQVWNNLNTCPNPNSAAQCRANPTLSAWDFSTLDTILADLKTAGVNDVVFTLGFTPTWAQTVNGGNCTLSGNSQSCWLPPDMNADGSCSGTLGSISTACALWDNAVENFAAHANNANYLQTHAHIKYWEPWNEVWEDTTISSCCGTPNSINATYAQLLRLTEDTNCIITGRGTIHNMPVAGSSVSCATYLADLGYSLIDPNAKILMPSQTAYSASGKGGSNVFQNLLYCNASPVNDNGGSTTCTWSGGANWFSNAVDIINFHYYITNQQPEAVLPVGSAHDWTTKIANAMNATDRAKPLWSGEGSSGDPTGASNIWNDNYSMAAFAPRYAALLWSSGVAEALWFGYNEYNALWNGSTLTPAGSAWQQTSSWLVGASPVNTPFCANAGTVWTCALNESNRKPAMLVWDSQYGPGGTTAPVNCTTASVPTICGSTSYSVPALYSSDWVDTAGTSHPYSSTVTVGAAPILLEGPLPGGGVRLSGRVKVTGYVVMNTQ